MRKRKILGCALAAVLSMLPAVQALAAGPVDGGTAKFTDRGIESDFKDREIWQEIGNLLPGGSVTVQVKLENQGSQSTDWYMTNQVLRSLEESSDTAKGGAYAYELSYTSGATGEVTTLYSSQSVGGGESREGLHEADDALGEYLYLDRLGVGGTGRVSLTVALDAETLGNAYQSTLADLHMAFAVEVASGGEGSAPDSEGSLKDREPSDPSGSRVSSVLSLGGVQTGDDSHLMLWSVLALVCGLLLLFLAVVSLRREKGGRQS